MIRHAVIAALIAAPLAADESPPAADLLRFTNGNQIDGRFGGMDAAGVITWTRPDVATPMPFQRDKIRQVVLRNARPLSPLLNPCHVALVNGDRLPGNVVAADSETITIATTSAGTLVLPRDTVSVISPNPFGGRLVYAGPFDEKGWSVVRSTATPEDGDDPFGRNPRARAEGKETKDAEDRPTWVHTGASWFTRGGGDAVTLDAGMPDRALIRFKLGWRSRPNISVAFHADLQQPEPKKKAAEDEKDREGVLPNFGGMQNLARLFGTAYVLNFQSGYIHLQRTGFDDEGQPEVERVRVGSTSVRLQDTGEALFEIRCDRSTGVITVHIDGEFAVQWNISDQNPQGPVEEDEDEAGSTVRYRAPGGGLGFMVQGNAAPIRISDVVVAEWNGLTDSARSMEIEERDVALLANGTDRFSGKLVAIRDGMAEIEAAYGPLKVPMKDIAEIHLAGEDRRDPVEEPAGGIVVHLQPVGRLSGIPQGSAGGRILLDSPLAGKVDLDLAPAVVLEFQSVGGFLDDWDDAP